MYNKKMDELKQRNITSDVSYPACWVGIQMPAQAGAALLLLRWAGRGRQHCPEPLLPSPQLPCLMPLHHWPCFTREQL